ncbi:hypothetical protein AJ80_02943 [Polytolypa hystricis UAMH7299]|uniref:Uncharacterized protein n=1 Tax=Polytolypa hystricis (strain UAMH7299) TaxID=1447883 RepID=A0A2B7YQ65_POLH7|nr:hypothetical protein AJ80_02943 [Polytolypa hystricis UAMH7299]
MKSTVAAVVLPAGLGATSPVVDPAIKSYTFFTRPSCTGSPISFGSFSEVLECATTGG